MRTLHHFFVLFCFGLSGTCFAGSYEDYFQAIRQDNAPVVSNLLSRGFDPNTPDPTGNHGLVLALRIKSVNVARVIVRAEGANVDVRTEKDETPLMLAALRGFVDICSELISKDADVNKPGWTPLHYAATGGHEDVIALLLEHHAYVDAESPNGSTPLMMAAMYGSIGSVRLLVDAGADVELKNGLGLTAADFARQGGRPDAQELLDVLSRKARTGGVW